MKMKFKELALTIACIYTLISVGGAILNLIVGTETNNANVLMMFWFVVIACSVLSIYHFFSNLSPLLVIFIQYVITIALVMGTALVMNYFSPLAKGGFRDLFVSFTIPYILLVPAFYIEVFKSTKKQNEMLKVIQEEREDCLP